MRCDADHSVIFEDTTCSNNEQYKQCETLPKVSRTGVLVYCRGVKDFDEIKMIAVSSQSR